MKNPNLDHFIEKVMTIETDYPGMGGASSVIVGGSSTNSDIAYDLRKNTIAFAAEYSRISLDVDALKQLSEQLQGSLLALRMMNIISDERLEEFSSDLAMLLSSRIQ